MLRARIRWLIALLVVMVLVHGINIGLEGELVGLGILPRTFDALPHVFLAPFIHGSLGHLLSNLVGLTVFSVLCLIRSVGFYLGASLFVIAVGGLLVWLFGRPVLHVGASGWVFGLWSVSIAMGWFDRRLINIVISVLVLFFYGGMIFGVLPNSPMVSFESHLFGAIAGVVYAFLYVLFNKNQTRKMD